MNFLMCSSEISSSHPRPNLYCYRHKPDAGFRSVSKYSLYQQCLLPHSLNPWPHLKLSFPSHKHQESTDLFPCANLKNSGKYIEKPLSQGPQKHTEMPSVQKLLHFLSSALLSAAGVAILGYGMSTDWAKSTLDCSPSTSDNFNGSSALEIGLFNGTEVKISCPRFDTLGIPVEGKLAIWF